MRVNYPNDRELSYEQTKVKITMIEERMTLYDLQLQIFEKITYHLLAKVEIVNKIVYCWRIKFPLFTLRREINWKLNTPAITIHYLPVGKIQLYFPMILMFFQRIVIFFRVKRGKIDNPREKHQNLREIKLVFDRYIRSFIHFSHFIRGFFRIN